MESRVERAETMAHRAGERAAWDVVTCRAVGSLAMVAELALPLARVGGIVVCWKRHDGSGALAAEVTAARDAVREAGGEPAEVVTPADPDLLPGHRLVVLAKARPGRLDLPRTGADRRRPLLP
jgi:16S rRNA (guanine527-N7)-methyltransferase